MGNEKNMEFQKKGPDDLKVVKDATSDTALAESSDEPPAAHTEAAANAVTDAEAGAATKTSPGIEPIIDTTPSGDGKG